MANLKLTLKAWPVVTLLTIGLCYLTQLVAGWFGFVLDEQETVRMMKAMGADTWRILTQNGFFALFRHEVSCKFLINLLLVLAFAPIVEETIFRGLLFRLPLKLFKVEKRHAFYFILIASSILFSATHYLMMPQANNAFLALIFFGLAQCWLYRKTNHLWCPMLNHALFNLTNLILLFTLVE